MNAILELIENNLWDEALKQFIYHTENKKPTDSSCIIGTTIMEHYGKYDSMFEFIRGGLKLNPYNYELYLLLGNYYSTRNKIQAYLSYENALYHCINSGIDEDRNTLEQLLKNTDISSLVFAKRVSFVILSYNTLDYTKACIESIRTTCYSQCYEIIVIDNASNDGSVEWLSEQQDIILIKNSENVGFPAGCNQGINAANADNDIFLLNNDTILLPNSLFWLRIGLYNGENVGATGAVTNYAANGQIVGGHYDTVEDYIHFGTGINVPDVNPYEEKTFLVMFAMLIKRKCLNMVGLLDELYTPGNFEDNDYGLRIMQNSYKCILCHNSYIYHFGSRSFGKNIRHYTDIYYTNREKFKNKWGFYDDYYTHARLDVISLINFKSSDEFSVLEVGCGLGETLAKIKYNFPNASVSGIEIVDNIASLGNNRFDIISGDIETMSLNKKYDIILFPDVLEHLRYPENILVSVKNNLKTNGYIISSIPNLMNASIIYGLLHGFFTYQDAGILDNTHLRFFTLHEIYGMFDRAGYEISHVEASVSPKESTDSYKDFFNQLLSINGMAPKEQFDAYQYLVRATPKS